MRYSTQMLTSLRAYCGETCRPSFMLDTLQEHCNIMNADIEL